jgi:hypothetical protein
MYNDSMCYAKLREQQGALIPARRAKIGLFSLILWLLLFPSFDSNFNYFSCYANYIKIQNWILHFGWVFISENRLRGTATNSSTVSSATTNEPFLRAGPTEAAPSG